MAQGKPNESDTAVQIATLTLNVQHLSTLVERQGEAMDGTNRTRGLREKVVLAEMNIESNKQAYLEVMQEVGRIETRLGASMAAMNSDIKGYIDTKFAELKKEADTAKTFLDKMRPWVNGLQWLITIVAGLVVTMIVTGKLHIGLAP